MHFGDAGGHTEASIPTRISSYLTRRLGLEEQEQRLLLLMGLLVATLLCAYTLAKVVRDALFLDYFGALSLPYAYVAVALASAGFVWLDGTIARRFTRLNATRFHQYLAIALCLAAAIGYPFARHATAAAFYLWTGSQAMFLIPHFWVLALDVWDSQRARRLFPILTGCGLIGGLLGGGIAGWLTPWVKRVGLIWISAAMFIVAHVLTRFIERHRALHPTPLETAITTSRWEILRRSPYLRLLATALALSVVVGTLIDFQFKFFIQRFYPDPHELTQFLGKFQAVLSGLALLLQFGAVGWLFHRLGLTGATSLQPISVMLFAWWVGLTSGWWVVVAFRWLQGVVIQTIGKSSAEMYYMAIRPPERRRIKPVIDTLVERWSDAAVGLLLIGMLHMIGVSLKTLVGVTVALAAVWLVLLYFLNRSYGRAFQTALSHRWIEPEAAPDVLRTPAARRALTQALREGDEPRLILALRLCSAVRHPAIARGIREALRHPSPAVRAAAIDAMEALRLRDPDGIIAGFVADPHEALSGSAIRYQLTMSRDPVAFARGLLEGPEPALRRRIVDALFECPHAAPGAVTVAWIDGLIASGSTEDLVLAARALGSLPGSGSRARLLSLLADPDVEVKRAALLSAARRPARALLDPILPLLFVPELTVEARRAVAAIGNAAVPALARFLSGEQSARAESIAGRTLAEIATQPAIDALVGIVRSADPAQRLIGLRHLSAIRVQLGRPVIPRGFVHRLFLREMRSYRSLVEPALGLEHDPEPEIRLLGESYGEFAEAALERSLRALACWYDPKPLSGAFESLKSREFEGAAPGLEYLSHVLPRGIFRPVGELFQGKLVRGREAPTFGRERVEEWVREAWQMGDAWLRACAVRASRHLPAVDRSWFEGGTPSPIVDAELSARFGEAGAAPAARLATAREGNAPC